MKTAIILEDEIIASNRLKRMISEVDPEIEILMVFDTIVDTANYLQSAESQPDILFVDIQVADGNSFELFSLVKLRSKIIFTTAYDDYAVKAFRKNATDYLTKPIKIEELREAIERAKPITDHEKLPAPENKYKEMFLLRFGTKLQTLVVQDIAYVHTKNKVNFFYAFDRQRIPSDFNLHEIEKMLDPQQFYRVNRQLIINIKALDTIKTHTASRLKLTLAPDLGEEIVVSTEKSKLFKQWLDR